jgi:hydrogenase/urease accessory protein HupE
VIIVIRTKMFKRLLLPILSMVVMIFAPAVVRAHDPGLSSVDLRVSPTYFAVTLGFARKDIERLVPIDSDGDETITETEFEAAKPELMSAVAAALDLRLNERQLVATSVEADFDSTGGIQLLLSYPRESGQHLQLTSRLVAKIGFGHRQFLSIRDENGNLIDERLLGGSDETTEVEISKVSRAGDVRYFARFVVLGIFHILTGYDHLLFLVGLLIVGTTFSSAAKIVTSFTFAHSITLAASSLGYLELSSGIVEPLIAASIIYVGVENLLRPEMKSRWLVTFLFGLIHGFGFAFVLNELGIGTTASSAALPLFAFNLGVELGQIGVVAVTLPLIWKLRHQHVFSARLTPVFSLLVVVAGAYWLVDRSL